MLSCVQFARIGRGSIVALSPPGRIAKLRWPSCACGGVRTRPSTVPFETTAPTRSAGRWPAFVEREAARRAATEATASGLPGCANRRTLPVCTGVGSPSDDDAAPAPLAACDLTFSVTGGWLPAVAASFGFASPASAGSEDVAEAPAARTGFGLR